MNKIKEYIKKAIAKGYDKETIKKLLKSEGWEEEEIEKVFNSLNKESLLMKKKIKKDYIKISLLLLILTTIFYIGGIDIEDIVNTLAFFILSLSFTIGGPLFIIILMFAFKDFYK